MYLDLEPWQIRSWRMSDQAALQRYADNVKIWRNLRDRFPHPYSARDASQYLRSVVQHHPETSFAIASAQEAIGAIGLQVGEDVYRRTAELGFWVGEPFWGRGIATAAVNALSEWAFDAFALQRIHSYVFEWNPASRRVLEKAAFKLEGRLLRSAVKDGEVIDQFLYARTSP